MKLPYFDYRAPATLAEAVAELAALGSDAKILAGGQSLPPMMRCWLARPVRCSTWARSRNCARAATWNSTWKTRPYRAHDHARPTGPQRIRDAAGPPAGRAREADRLPGGAHARHRGRQPA